MPDRMRARRVWGAGEPGMLEMLGAPTPLPPHIGGKSPLLRLILVTKTGEKDVCCDSALQAVEG